MDNVYVIPEDDYLLRLIRNTKNNINLNGEIMIIEKLRAYMVYEESQEIMLAYFKKMFEMDIEKVPLVFTNILSFIMKSYEKDSIFLNGLQPDYFYNLFLNVEGSDEKFNIKIDWNTFSATSELISKNDMIKNIFRNMLKNDLNGFPIKSEIDWLTPVSFWIANESRNFYSENMLNINKAMKILFINGLDIKEESFHMESVFDVKKLNDDEINVNFARHEIILDKNLLGKDINEKSLSFMLKRMLFLSGKAHVEWISTEGLKYDMNSDLSQIKAEKKKVKKF